MLGFNTKQWWIYDEKDDCYIDPPKAVLDSLEGLSQEEQEDMLYEICSGRPAWLLDEEYRYYEDMDI